MSTIPALILAALLAVPAAAQTLVIVPAEGEVTRANDQATAIFAVEEQDKDKAAAASRVNTKMRQGTEILKAADPQGKLRSYGYYTYPVYAETRPDLPPPKVRQLIGWRVGQYVELKTLNLAQLEKTVAAAQRLLGLDNLQFGLSPAVIKLADDQRIAVTFQTLNERIASVARAMGKTPADAVLDTVDFEGTGRYAENGGAEQRVMVTGSRVMKQQMEVAEPSFEPGETTLRLRVVGKVRFK